MFSGKLTSHRRGSRQRGRRSCKIIAVVQRVFDQFWRLHIAQKVLVVLLGVLLLFAASFLISTAVFRSMGGGSEQANTRSKQGATGGGHDTGSANPAKTPPEASLNISSARWEGQKAVVEGAWKGGEVSSVHCDLFEGVSPTRWWDRSVGTQMDWSGQTFTQEFVSARGTEDWEPLDPLASYNVNCSAWFAGGIGTNASGQVKGKPSE
jgi:hypothetical protein